MAGVRYRAGSDWLALLSDLQVHSHLHEVRVQGPGASCIFLFKRQGGVIWRAEGDVWVETAHWPSGRC